MRAEGWVTVSLLRSIIGRSLTQLRPTNLIYAPGVTVKKRGDALDPRRLAERQLAIDEEHLRFIAIDNDNIGRRPLGADERARAVIYGEAKKRKIARMQMSPLAFLRGAAPLFYEMLGLAPDLGEGPL